MRPLVVLAIVLAPLLSCRQAIAGNETIAWPRAIELFQGELAELSIAGPEVMAVEGAFGKERIYFYSDGLNHFSGMIGADVVGMSTVPEVLVAVHAGLAVVGFSVVTDMCLPDALEPVDVPKIIATANAAEPKLTQIMKSVVSSLGS